MPIMDWWTERAKSDSEWDWLSFAPPHKIREFQDRLLSDYLKREVAAFSPYYSRVFAEQNVPISEINGVRDLSRLPFTTKELLICAADQDPLAFVLQPDAQKIRAHWPITRKLTMLAMKLSGGDRAVRRALGREYLPVFMTATTGRAARPVSFLYSNTDMRRLSMAGIRMAGIMGLSPADRAVNLFPYAPHLAFWQVAFAGLEAGVFMLSTGGGKTVGTGGNLRVLDKVNPTCILGVPSYVYHLLRRAESEGIRVPALRMIVLGAEKVPAGLKEKLIDLAVRLGATRPRVLGTYGFTEAKMAWGECDRDVTTDDVGYHLFPDMGIIEIVDPETGRVMEDGQSGEIVYTSLGAHGTAVVRYRTGDFARGGILRGPCPACGRTVPRLTSDITRLSNRKDFRLTKVKGTLVDLNHIASILGDMREIEEWQIEISKLNDDPVEIDVMTLYISPAKGSTLNTQSISRQIFEATEVAVNRVNIIPLEEMIARIGLENEMKEKRFVDRRPT